jgi:hypothetical protein
MLQLNRLSQCGLKAGVMGNQLQKKSSSATNAVMQSGIKFSHENSFLKIKVNEHIGATKRQRYHPAY